VTDIEVPEGADALLALEEPAADERGEHVTIPVLGGHACFFGTTTLVLHLLDGGVERVVGHVDRLAGVAIGSERIPDRHVAHLWSEAADTFGDDGVLELVAVAIAIHHRGSGLGVDHLLEGLDDHAGLDESDTRILFGAIFGDEGVEGDRATDLLGTSGDGDGAVLGTLALGEFEWLAEVVLEQARVIHDREVEHTGLAVFADIGLGLSLEGGAQVGGVVEQDLQHALHPLRLGAEFTVGLAGHQCFLPRDGFFLKRAPRLLEELLLGVLSASAKSEEPVLELLLELLELLVVGIFEISKVLLQAGLGGAFLSFEELADEAPLLFDGFA